MSEQEKMDDIIRSKFSEMDFPFDEENWAKAEEMIVAARAKEKRRRWGIIFFFGILIGVLVMIPFVLKNTDSEKTNTTLVEQKNKTAGSITENKENKLINTSETKAEENKIIDKTQEVAEAPKAEVVEENQAPNVEIKKSTKEVQKINSGEISPSSQSIKPEVKTVPVKIKKPDEPTVAVNTNISAAPLGDKATEKTVSTKKETKKSEAPVKAVEAKEKENKLVPVIPTTKKKEATDKSETKKEIPPVVITTPETKKKEDVVKQETKKDVSPVATKPDDTKNNSAIVTNPVSVASIDSAKQQPVVTKKDSSTVTPVIVKKDSLPTATKQTETKKDSAQKPKSSWTVSLDGGINGFLSGGSGISPFAGINITKVLTEKWEIGSGIYYTYIPTFSGASTFTTDATYDFGSSFKLTEIVTTKLHYVTAPLFVKYNFNEKNAVIAGANFYYLFNSSNIVTTYEISYAGIQNKTTSKATGYYNGFSPYDVGIMVGYRKKLFEKLGVALYANYGLLNLQKSGSASSNNIRNNISGQLMLTYKLFK